MVPLDPYSSAHCLSYIQKQINYDAANPAASYVEIAGRAGESLLNTELHYYGSNRTFVSEIDLGGATFSDEEQGWGFFSFPVTLEDNGGFCLVFPQLFDTIAYGPALGSGFEGTDGPCDFFFDGAGNGLIADDANTSVQKQGEGVVSNDFLWTVGPSSEGLINENQCFIPEGEAVCRPTPAPTSNAPSFTPTGVRGSSSDSSSDESSSDESSSSEDD